MSLSKMYLQTRLVMLVVSPLKCYFAPLSAKGLSLRCFFFFFFFFFICKKIPQGNPLVFQYQTYNVIKLL